MIEESENLSFYHSRLNNPDYLILPSSAEMQLMDQETINSGIPSIELMEKAGNGLAEEIKKISKFNNLLILCGTGNNAGDGLVIARQLANKSNVIVVVAFSEKKSNEFLHNLKLLPKNVEVFFYDLNNAKEFYNLRAVSIEELNNLFNKSDLIVDALLGTGQTLAPRGNVKEILEVLENSKSHAIKVAVDIPTGLNASTGQCYSPCFKADYTIAIAYVKRGLLQAPACDFVGEIISIDIGIKSKNTECRLLTSKDFPTIKRAKSAHKASSKSVLVIGSSAGMAGASALSAMAALRVGVGLVTRVIPSGLLENSAIAPEIMHKRVGSKAYFDKLCVEQIFSYLDKVGSIVIGPGMGDNPETTEFTLEFLNRLKAERNIPCVVDADALRAFNIENLNTFSEQLVITPHPGEFARISNLTLEQVKNDRFSAIKEVSSKFKGVVVLKGFGTLVTSNNETIYLNATGNSAMASAGMGDVLAGMIAGFIVQGYTLKEASFAGVYLHGMTSDSLYQERKAPVIASDILDYIPEVMSRGWFEVC
jgi:hydroxyethylthiazole kinase-like uncharacterized protein yjeF